MRILVILLFFLLTLNADETLTRLFNQLKTVPKSDKFKVVNQIKKHIIALKQQERVEAIKVLQAKKRAEQKRAEVEHFTVNHDEDSHDMKDCTVDTKMMDKNYPMRQSNMKKMSEMPKMNQMNTLQNMNNLNNMQNRPLTQERRDFSRRNIQEGMGHR